jgi:hypothetical protein
MNHRMHQQARGIDQNMPLQPLIFFPASYPLGSMQAPLFSALHTLAIDDAGGWAGLPIDLFAASLVECIMSLAQRPVVSQR